jgi:hypothetical protein
VNTSAHVYSESMGILVRKDWEGLVGDR